MTDQRPHTFGVVIQLTHDELAELTRSVTYRRDWIEAGGPPPEIDVRALVRAELNRIAQEAIVAHLDPGVEVIYR
jgi:hypothetical protein